MLENVVVDGAGALDISLEAGALRDLCGQVAVFLVQVCPALGLTIEPVRLVVASDRQSGDHAFLKLRLQGRDLALDEIAPTAVSRLRADLDLLGQVEGTTVDQLEVGVL